MDRQILCYAIPSFEIELARVNDSHLRTRPIALTNRGSRAVIQDLSAEARKEGLAIGMSLSTATRLCPSLRLLSSDPARLHVGEQQVLTVLKQFAPVWECTRPGEVLCDMTGTHRLFGPAIDIGAKIERDILRRYRLHGVMGIGTNKLVAQLASALVRPVQLYDVKPGAEERFVHPLPVNRLPLDYDAHAALLRRLLHDLHIETFGALASVPLPAMELAFGSYADRLAQWARGVDVSPLRPRLLKPFIEEAGVLHPETITDERIKAAAYDALERIASTLRRQVRGCRVLRVTLRHTDGVVVSRSGGCATLTQWEDDMWPIVRNLVRQAFRRRIQIKEITLRAAGLEPMVEQLQLFSQHLPEEQTRVKQHRLVLALDQIRERFGTTAIQRGIALHDRTELMRGAGTHQRESLHGA